MWGVIIGVFIFCSVYAMLLFSIYYLREKRLLHRLTEMIGLASDGKCDFNKVDETMVSSLENQMSRFLGDSMLSQKNMKEQKEKIQTLISDISHQTITPISNILLYTQLLEEKDDELRFHDETSAIQEQTKKLSFLIDSLVKMSRLENGIIAIEQRPNSIQELIETVVRQCKAKADVKQIDVTVNPTNIVAFFDMKWSVEAVYNILDNAVKYTSVGGSIKIKTDSYSFYCRIDVTDNGIGIDENEIANVFARFYRSKEVIEEEGIGIGLYLARQIITMQRGYIKVTSSPHMGSTFSIFLPVL